MFQPVCVSKFRILFFITKRFCLCVKMFLCSQKVKLLLNLK